MRIIADRDVCIGAGNCVFAAPELFGQYDDGTVELLDAGPAAEHHKRARAAVARCPSGALTLAEGD